MCLVPAQTSIAQDGLVQEICGPRRDMWPKRYPTGDTYGPRYMWSKTTWSDTRSNQQICGPRDMWSKNPKHGPKDTWSKTTCPKNTNKYGPRDVVQEMWSEKHTLQDTYGPRHLVREHTQSKTQSKTHLVCENTRHPHGWEPPTPDGVSRRMRHKKGLYSRGSKTKRVAIPKICGDTGGPSSGRNVVSTWFWVGFNMVLA